MSGKEVADGGRRFTTERSKTKQGLQGNEPPADHPGRRAARLFFVALISGGAIFSLLHSLLGGILLFVVGVFVARRATKYDVEILRVLFNSSKFRRRYDPLKWEPTKISIRKRNVQN